MQTTTDRAREIAQSDEFKGQNVMFFVLNRNTPSENVDNDIMVSLPRHEDLESEASVEMLHDPLSGLFFHSYGLGDAYSFEVLSIDEDQVTLSAVGAWSSEHIVIQNKDIQTSDNIFEVNIGDAQFPGPEKTATEQRDTASRAFQIAEEDEEFFERPLLFLVLNRTNTKGRVTNVEKPDNDIFIPFNELEDSQMPATLEEMDDTNRDFYSYGLGKAYTLHIDTDADGISSLYLTGKMWTGVLVLGDEHSVDIAEMIEINIGDTNFATGEVMGLTEIEVKARHVKAIDAMDMFADAYVFDPQDKKSADVKVNHVIVLPYKRVQKNLMKEYPLLASLDDEDMETVRFNFIISQTLDTKTKEMTSRAVIDGREIVVVRNDDGFPEAIIDGETTLEIVKSKMIAKPSSATGAVEIVSVRGIFMSPIHVSMLTNGVDVD